MDNLTGRNGDYIFQISKTGKVIFNHTKFYLLYHCVKALLTFNSVFHFISHSNTHTQHHPSKAAFKTFYTQPYSRNDFKVDSEILAI